MEPDSTASTRAVRAFLVTLFAVNIYRAATQSFTPDEATTYNRFVGPPLREVFSAMTANNHVLNSLMEILSTSYFHLTDLTLRLPSVLSGGLYLAAVYRLARRTFGDGWLFAGAVALLTLNPLVLDYLSAARGYGMALAFWMWALELMLEYLESDQSPASRRFNLWMNVAAVSLALSVAASLGFIVPAIALAVSFAVCLRRQARGPSHLMRQFVIPALVTAFLILVIPLNHIDLASFQVGASSLRQTIHSIAALSLFHVSGHVSGHGSDHGNDSSLPPVLAAALRVGLSLLFMGVIFAAARILRRREQGRVDALLVLLAGTMLLSFVTLELAHRMLGAPFPAGGSALYFIPVTSLAAWALVRKANRRRVGLGALTVAALCIAAYLLQFNVRIYGEWPEYAGARSVVKAIRSDAGRRHIRVGASSRVEPVLTYYRARYRLGNWEVVDGQPPAGTYDYYVLTREDAKLVEQRHLRVLFRDANLVVLQ